MNSTVFSLDSYHLDLKLRTRVYEEFLKNPDYLFLYGTSGFRNKSYLLPHICFRSGIAVGYLAKFLYPLSYGIILTASHNPKEDNGVKLVNEKGFMISMELEIPIQNFINAKNIEEGFSNFSKSVLKFFHNSNGIIVNSPGIVFAAHDTRESSKELYPLIQDGIAAINSKMISLGLMATPVLHTVTANYNKEIISNIKPDIDSLYQTYLKKMGNSFKNLMSKVSSHQNLKHYSPKIILDVANGAGAKTIKDIKTEFLDGIVEVEVINNDQNHLLNDSCGGEWVQKEKKLPINFEEKATKSEFELVKGVSFDGDADRVIYFNYEKNTKKIYLIEGDRFAILISKAINCLCKNIEADQLKLKEQNILNKNHAIDTQKWSKGIMQTAYANGGSTNYIKNELKIYQEYHATGVKHLHHNALKFSIGIYFEANGHGTLTYQHDVYESLTTLKREIQKLDHNNEYVKRLEYNVEIFLNILDLTNCDTGDAVIDFLLIESCLAILDLSLADLLNLYNDLPNLTSKCVVKHKTLIKTTYNELDVVEPEDLRLQLNELRCKHPEIRFTVRPSGTEDIVRVYVEAETTDEVNQHTNYIIKLLQNNETLNSQKILYDVPKQ